MQDKWLVIINPVSGGRSAPKRWAKIKPLFDDAGILYQEQSTGYRDHAAMLVRDAVKSGCRKIMILGGDGTANDVINGVLTSGADPEQITVAMVPAGTGNDWVRTIGKPGSGAELIHGLQRMQTFLHDVGIAYYQHDGKQKQRYFINIAGLGFEGAVAKRIYENAGKWYLGKLQYQLAIMRTLFVYKHTPMQITVDGSATSLTVLSIAAGNAKYNGGGLKQLPSALFDDGEFDMTVITDMPKWKMVLNLPKLQTGSHIGMREVRTFRGKHISIISTPAVHIDVDGEYIGTTPLRFEMAEQKIRVLKFG